MIKLKSIITEIKDLEVKRVGVIAKRQAAELLSKKGLKESDYFILKIRKSSIPNWVAMYRTNSIMTGRPIFWINQDIPNIISPDDNVIRVMVDSILHEWFHAIMDFFRIAGMRGIKVEIPYPRKYNQEEEDNAEEFGHWVGNSMWGDNTKVNYFEKCIAEFNRIWDENKS